MQKSKLQSSKNALNNPDQCFPLLSFSTIHIVVVQEHSYILPWKSKLQDCTKNSKYLIFQMLPCGLRH